MVRGSMTDLRWHAMATQPTPLRAVRIPDDVWQAALAKARERGETVSEVIRAALEAYIKQP